MNITKILTDLKSERDRIDRAIAAIEGLGSTGPRTVRRAARKTASRMSAAARRKLSQLMKQRWAAGKMRPGAKATPAPTSGRNRHVSAAGRKRIAEAAKRRWAAWRRMRKKPVAKVM